MKDVALFKILTIFQSFQKSLIYLLDMPLYDMIYVDSWIWFMSIAIQINFINFLKFK